jgi:hypothetical protein
MSRYQHEPPVPAVPPGTALLFVMCFQWRQAMDQDARDAAAVVAAVEALRPDRARHTFVPVMVSCPERYRHQWAEALRGASGQASSP